jgi:hypothetical protein
MDKLAVYQKTTKGRDEIATRAHKLPARERSVLIMVDGRIPLQRILHALRHLAEVEKHFADLIERGFIEPVATSTPATAGKHGKAEPPLSAEHAGQPQASLSSAKRFAARFLLDELGPDAETIVLRIEGCDKVEEVRPALEKARELLRAIRGRDSAELFWQRVSERLPEH